MEGNLDALYRLGEFWFTTVIPYGTVLSLVLALLESWAHKWWPEGWGFKLLLPLNDLVSRVLALNLRDKIAPPRPWDGKVRRVSDSMIGELPTK